MPDRELKKLDIGLTGAFYKYAGDMYYGRTAEQVRKIGWYASKDSVRVDNLLIKALTLDDDKGLDFLQPAHEQYQALKEQYAIYRKLKGTTWSKLKNVEKLKLGDTSEAVVEVREKGLPSQATIRSLLAQLTTRRFMMSD